MPTVLCISASPQPTSRTHALVSHVSQRLAAAGHGVRILEIRELPAAPLLNRDVTHPELIEAIHAVLEADALVVGTPVYQSAYSGLLKVFLDLLPRFALRGKAVLPLTIGGSTADVPAVDDALRPVLAALDAAHVPGWFGPAGHIGTLPDGSVLLHPASRVPIARITDEFSATLATRRRTPFFAACEPHSVVSRRPPRAEPANRREDCARVRVSTRS